MVAPHLKLEHLDVFACAVGDNAIHYLGHVKMMGAVQPFISGAISKTVNMPESATVEEIEQLHMDAWKLGIKAIAIYRDNCKAWQPLSSKKESKKAGKIEEEKVEVVEQPVVRVNARREMPRVRTSKTFEFHVSDLHGYFTVGEFEDGTPGELFVTVAKMGSTLAGLMDAFGRSISYGLQYGVPLKAYVRGMSNTSFAPYGITDDPEVRTASSIVDYIFRRLALEYLALDDRIELGLASLEDLEAEMQQQQTSLLEEPKAEVAVETSYVAAKAETPKVAAEIKVSTVKQGSTASAPICSNCGNITQAAGSCYVCRNCGSTTGCS